jgi:hypothetical protein
VTRVTLGLSARTLQGLQDLSPPEVEEGGQRPFADAERHVVEQHPSIGQLVTHSGNIHVTHNRRLSLAGTPAHPVIDRAEITRRDDGPHAAPIDHTADTQEHPVR